MQSTGVDALGRITGQYLGDGSLSSRGYAPGSGRLTYTNAAIDGNSPETVQNFTYAYDTVGNLRARTDLLRNLTETFTYDALDRLTGAVVDDGTTQTPVSYTYDAIGNLVEKDDIPGLASYGILYGATAGPHALTTLDKTAGADVTYTYDLNGNQLSGDGRTLIWTSYDLPASITRGGVTRTFAYGPDRARYRQGHSNGMITDYVQGLYERVKNGSADDHRHLITANGQVVAIHIDDAAVSSGSVTTRYLHTDHLGSVTAVTGDNGTVLETLSYDAFGRRREATDWVGSATAMTEVRGYTGHEHLDDVGLIHMNGRVYDPLLGRMLSPDPFVTDPLNLQSWNRYSYVVNNPLKYTDPSGFAFVPDCTAGCHLTLYNPLDNTSFAVLAYEWSRRSITAILNGTSDFTDNLISVFGIASRNASQIIVETTIVNTLFGWITQEGELGILGDFIDTTFIITLANPEMEGDVVATPPPPQPVNAGSAGSFGGGINPTINDGSINGSLTNTQIANIVFNETVSLFGSGIDEARRRIANILINRFEAGIPIGEVNGTKFTASDQITRPLGVIRVGNVVLFEKEILQSINQLVVDVVAERARGIDPANGAKFFGFRDLNKFTETGFKGLSRTKPRPIGGGIQFPVPSGVLGPFGNSNPDDVLGPDNIFFVPFGLPQ